MAKLTWQDLQKKYKAEWVAGDLIAKVEGKRQSLAKKKNGAVYLSFLGERLSLDAAVAAKAPPQTPRIRRTPPKTVKKTETPDAQA